MLFFPTAILEGSQLLQSSPITVLGASPPPYSNSEPPPTPKKNQSWNPQGHPTPTLKVSKLPSPTHTGSRVLRTTPQQSWDVPQPLRSNLLVSQGQPVARGASAASPRGNPGGLSATSQEFRVAQSLCKAILGSSRPPHTDLRVLNATPQLPPGPSQSPHTNPEKLSATPQPIPGCPIASLKPPPQSGGVQCHPTTPLKALLDTPRTPQRPKTNPRALNGTSRATSGCPTPPPTQARPRDPPFFPTPPAPHAKGSQRSPPSDPGPQQGFGVPPTALPVPPPPPPRDTALWIPAGPPRRRPRANTQTWRFSPQKRRAQSGAAHWSSARRPRFPLVPSTAEGRNQI